MTREDALEATIWLMDGNNQVECDERWESNPLALINEIYDDFKSRTCEKCKYMIKDSTGYPRCSNGSSIMPYEDGAIALNVDLEFGCNQFERKDDE